MSTPRGVRLVAVTRMAQGCVASSPEKERKIFNFSNFSKIANLLKTAMRSEENNTSIELGQRILEATNKLEVECKAEDGTLLGNRLCYKISRGSRACIFSRYVHSLHQSLSFSPRLYSCCSTLLYIYRLAANVGRVQRELNTILIHTYGLRESGKVFDPRRISRWDR